MSFSIRLTTKIKPPAYSKMRRLLDGFHFVRGRVAGVCSLRAWSETGEEAPSSHAYHGFAEAHFKGGPVSTILIRRWNLGA